MNRSKGVSAFFVLLAVSVVSSGCFLFPNHPPVAEFGVEYDVTEDPLVVRLDASMSSDPDGDAIADYMWTFGEDVEILTPLEFSKTVTVPILLVRYPEEGAYTVELLVVDEHGLMADPPPFTMQVVVPSIPVEPMS